MVGWAVAAVVVGLFIALVVSRVRRYGRLFAPKHYVEVAHACAALRTAALAHVDDVTDLPFTEKDPRAFVSRAGLAVVYTARASGGDVVHHISVSHPGHVTTHALGTIFVTWIALVLRWPIERVKLVVQPSTVHHAEIVLPRDEHARLSGSPLLEVTPANVKELQRECLATRARLMS